MQHDHDRLAGESIQLHVRYRRVGRVLGQAMFDDAQLRRAAEVAGQLLEALGTMVLIEQRQTAVDRWEVVYELLFPNRRALATVAGCQDPWPGLLPVLDVGLVEVTLARHLAPMDR